MENEADNGVFSVRISFGASRSQAYTKAVRLAKKFESYQNTGSEEKPTHCVEEDVSIHSHDTILKNLYDLYMLVAAWKSTNCIIKNYEDNYSQLYLSFREVRQCEVVRESSPLKDDYCRGRNLPADITPSFGCRFATGVRRSVDPPVHLRYPRPGHSLQSSPAWWAFASETENANVFRVEKNLIKITVLQSTQNQPCRACKYFDEDRLKNDIDALPEEIDVSSSTDFASSEYNDAGSLRRKLVRKYAYETFLPARPMEKNEESPELPTSRRVPSKNLGSVAVNDSTLESIRNIIITPIRHPEYFKELGAGQSRGFILHGPPGNGKTLLAESIAGEVQAHFETINGAEILSPWLGKSEGNIRAAFDRSRKHAPSILFIDEIDAIAPSRSAALQQHNNQIVSQLLTLLDDEQQDYVWVIASTNRLDAIDPAIMRPGRFDAAIFIGNPDLVAVAKIIRLHLREDRLQNVDISILAERMHGRSGAEIAAACRESQVQAINRALADGIAPRDLRICMQDFNL